MNRRCFVAFAAAFIACQAFAGSLHASELGRPQGKVILTVTGRIANRNDGDAATFDSAMLEALPRRNAVVRTPWIPGETSFEGPLGAALLDALGASGSTLHVVALDGYTADIPVQDFRDYPVILASRMNGEPMPVEDKGPLFIVYPFDLHPELYNDVYFGRSVWQVKTIDIR
jgi:hypothetical protein